MDPGVMGVCGVEGKGGREREREKGGRREGGMVGGEGGMVGREGGMVGGEGGMVGGEGGRREWEDGRRRREGEGGREKGGREKGGKEGERGKGEEVCIVMYGEEGVIHPSTHIDGSLLCPYMDIKIYCAMGM